MKTMPISRFKAQALQTIREVTATKQPVVITKRGKPVVEVVPYQDTTETPQPGQLADFLIFEEDIVSPLGSALWEACQ